MKTLQSFTQKTLLVGLLACLWACGSKDKANTEQRSTAVVENATPSPATQSSTTSLVIYKGESPYITIQKGNDKAEITVEQTVLRVHQRKEDKRKYETPQGIIAEIKYKDEGFKLRNPEGQLRWKVKIDSEKIKISDNEENNNPYEIKENDKQKVKVKRNDNEVATAKQHEGGKISIASANGQTQLQYKDGSLKKSLAVLAIEDLPLTDRVIIFYELWEQGQ
jgi:hypothetical protein